MTSHELMNKTRYLVRLLKKKKQEKKTTTVDQNTKQLATALDHHQWVGSRPASMYPSVTPCCVFHAAYYQVYDDDTFNSLYHKSEDECQSASSESSRQRQRNMCERYFQNKTCPFF